VRNFKNFFKNRDETCKAGAEGRNTVILNSARARGGRSRLIKRNARRNPHAGRVSFFLSGRARVINIPIIFRISRACIDFRLARPG